MRVVLVRRGATQEAYLHRGRGAIPGVTELKLRLWLLLWWRFWTKWQ
jgi:hypothetical protein